MENIEKISLFLVVLGGRASKANVELHDVRWVIGERIEDTFDLLRKSWFGSPKGLHIDSYKKITNIDGYRVNLINIKNKKIKSKKLAKEISSKKNLWFINIGGYHPSSMQEKHEFGLVVASSPFEAKNIAKSKWLIGCKKKHKDDLASLKIFSDFDNCKIIKKICDWEIELYPENNLNEENNAPDWYGYKRIDN